MFSEKEKLSIIDKYNEYVMTGLRTIVGNFTYIFGRITLVHTTKIILKLEL